MFTDKDKNKAPHPPPPSPPHPPAQAPDGPILYELRRERIRKLVEVNKLNAELEALETRIAWFERNQIAEVYFPLVKAILERVGTKVEKENHD